MNLEDWLYPLLAPYERLPRGIKRALGFSYRQMPQSWRLGRRYAEFRDLVAFGERWSPADWNDDLAVEDELPALQLVE